MLKGEGGQSSDYPKICEISNFLALTQTHTTYYIIKFRYYFLEYFNSLNNMRTIIYTLYPRTKSAAKVTQLKCSRKG